ncbi:GTP cyclohydrolase II [Pseudohyphozyma bogoriensis]|nr:GTP cyclohydrolase II [Pseudohyphozyma bogoriensis]
MADYMHHVSPVDLNILSLLTQPELPSSDALPRTASRGKRAAHSDRRPVGTQDPLMVAAAASAGPDVTRNHFFHEYFPKPLAYASCDAERPVVLPSPGPKMQSQQAPRRVRLAKEEEQRRQAEALAPPKPSTSGAQPIDIPAANQAEIVQPPVASPTSTISPSSPSSKRRLSISDSTKILRQQASPSTSPAFQARASPSSSSSASVPATATKPELVVQCQVRTRIPTPHGHIFLYLYKNNHDDKEHLAFVADHAQMEAHPGDVGPASLPFLRSTTLDSVWREGETEMERIVRGAYVGRLSASTVTPSTPGAARPTSSSVNVEAEPPLVRIHSECFTGETIGSQRCDCGEQLDEAFRLITEVGRGVVVYLRQEGRGIGLLEKMRAYNLQDLGHDTVTANLLLGHGADQRTYDIAGAILRDLGVPEVRLLTNNPDKIEQIEKEGIAVVERVAMVPRSWTAPVRPRKSGSRPRRAKPAILSGARLLALAEDQMILASQPGSSSEGENEYEEEEEDDEEFSSDSDASHNLRRAGVGMIGAGVTRSAELDKYLRTKVERMGHLLKLPTQSSGGKKTPGEHPLASSVTSLETDSGSLACGSGCEECDTVS